MNNESIAAAHKALAEKIAAVMREIPESEFEDDTRRFYTCFEDTESLHHTEPVDAVREFIDVVHADPSDPLPAKVMVYEFKPMKATTSDYFLQDLLESLDEEYGDPDGGDDPVTPLMRAAADLLVEVIHRQYRPWACEPVGSFAMATEEDD